MAITNLKKDQVTPDKPGQRNDTEQKANQDSKPMEQKGLNQPRPQQPQGAGGRGGMQTGMGLMGPGMHQGRGFMPNRGMGGRGQYMGAVRGRGGGRYDSPYQRVTMDTNQQQKQQQTK